MKTRASETKRVLRNPEEATSIIEYWAELE
jgi:hypothetical protein